MVLGLDTVVVEKGLGVVHLSTWSSREKAASIPENLEQATGQCNLCWQALQVACTDLRALVYGRFEGSPYCTGCPSTPYREMGRLGASRSASFDEVNDKSGYDGSRPSMCIPESGCGAPDPEFEFVAAAWAA
jgi:hypothetical protein